MITPDQISSKISNYLDDIIGGREMVSYVDGVVSSDAVYDYDEKVQAVVMKYQNLLALYVDDPVKRLESSAFYGPDKLRSIATHFKQELDALVR